MTTDEAPDIVHREPADVARRCLGLLAVVERSYTTTDVADLWAWAEKTRINLYLTAEETAFFYAQDPPQELRNALSWRAEALVPLLWSLEEIPQMPPLNKRVDLTDYHAVQRIAANPDTFIADAALRSPDVLDAVEADLYHQHWRVRDAQLFGKTMPADLDADIVYERRYGMSWVVGWGDEWDDVPTDT